jgi:hypothetical protein
VPGTLASERWKNLSTRKLKELETRVSEIQYMQSLLNDMMNNCHCDTLEICGKGIFRQIDGPKDKPAAKCCSRRKDSEAQPSIPRTKRVH